MMNLLYPPFFLFKDQILSEMKEYENVQSEEERMSSESSILHQNVDRKRQEEEENASLLGTVAKTMESRRSTPQRRSLLYIIGDYLYNGYKQPYSRVDGTKVLNLQCSSYFSMCKARVLIDPDSLKVLKFRWMHTCTRDPDMKFQIQMENEMKNLAKSTKDTLKDIYNKVCLKNPVIGKRIEYQNMYYIMKRRR